jgi:hypothetical protein
MRSLTELMVPLGLLLLVALVRAEPDNAPKDTASKLITTTVELHKAPSELIRLPKGWSHVATKDSLRCVCASGAAPVCALTSRIGSTRRCFC